MMTLRETFALMFLIAFGLGIAILIVPILYWLLIEPWFRADSTVFDRFFAGICWCGIIGFILLPWDTEKTLID